MKHSVIILLTLTSLVLQITGCSLLLEDKKKTKCACINPRVIGQVGSVVYESCMEATVEECTKAYEFQSGTCDSATVVKCDLDGDLCVVGRSDIVMEGYKLSCLP